jgi:hypothetical protein
MDIIANITSINTRRLEVQGVTPVAKKARNPVEDMLTHSADDENEHANRRHEELIDEENEDRDEYSETDSAQSDEAAIIEDVAKSDDDGEQHLLDVRV